VVASSIRVVKTWEELAAARSAWVDLADRCGALPSASPEWILAAWRAFGSGRLCTVMVDDLERPGTLLGLGVFVESRAPGPRLVRSAVGATGAPAELLVDPAHPQLAHEIVAAALGSTPSIFRSAAMLGADRLSADAPKAPTVSDTVASADRGQIFVVANRCDPARTLWELGIDALEVGTSGAAEMAADAGLQIRIGHDVDVDEKALRHLDQAFHGPTVPDGADRRAAFVPEVLDGFARHGRLVWPIASRGGEIVATSAWLVAGRRSMLWLRWALEAPDGPGADIAGAIPPLRALGVTSVVVSNPLVLPPFAPSTRCEPDTVEVGNRTWLRSVARAWARAAVVRSHR
jgi:hypothetical protein